MTTTQAAQVGSYLNLEDRGVGLGPNGLPSYSMELVAAGLRTNREWTMYGLPSMTVTYSFRQSDPSSRPDGIEDFIKFNSDQISLAIRSLQNWEDLVGKIKFVPASNMLSDEGDIVFNSYSLDYFDRSGSSYAPSVSYFGKAEVWINNKYMSNTDIGIGKFGTMTMVHEIGHALGLEHTGYYDATDNPVDQNTGKPRKINYNDDAEYFEDSMQYSVMSYFNASNTGAMVSYGPNNTNVYASSPQMEDIASIQLIYGKNQNTRIGNTVYGFGAKDVIGSIEKDIPEFFNTSSGNLVFSVWDSGGIDTFNFSNYTNNQKIDLREGHFSDVGQFIGNVSIAVGTVIENAFGGTGNDKIQGNSANNTFYMSDGADVVYGNGGVDTVDLKFATGQFMLDVGVSGSTITYGGNTTTMIGISAIRGTAGANNFSQGTEMSDVVVMGGDEIDTFNISAGMNAEGGIGNDVFVFTSLKANSQSYVKGGDDRDTIDVSRFSGSLTIDLATGNMTSNANAVVSFGSIEKFTIGSTKVTIQGGVDEETITSGNGNSVIRGGGGIDHIFGLSVSAGASANYLYGDAGNDVIKADGAAYIFGGADDDDITGSGEADQINGGLNNDHISAGGGDDVIFGISGIDEVDGQGDFDELKEIGTGLGHLFELVGDKLHVSLGVDVAKLTSIERVTFVSPSASPDFSFLTADAVGILAAAGHALSGADLRAALLAAGKDIDGQAVGRLYTSDSYNPVTGGGSSVIDGTTIGGGVTYASGPLTVTLGDYPEAGHIGTVVGNGIHNELFNLTFVEGSPMGDLFQVSGSSPFSKSLSVNGMGMDDTLSFADLAIGSGLNVNVAAGSATTSAGTLLFTQFERFSGSAGEDTFRFQFNGTSVNAGLGKDTADFSSYGGMITDQGLTGFERFVGSIYSDTFKMARSGYEFVGGGGTGFDFVSYDGRGAITVAGNSGTGGAASGDSYNGIYGIMGSGGADTFSGAGIRYFGGGGDDTYLGGSGGWFDGGSSTDTVSYANAGRVVLNAYYAGTQNNYGDYLTGVERFIGSNDADEFADGSGTTMLGGKGDDFFSLSWGSNAFGGENDDTFLVKSSFTGSGPRIDGGSGRDTLVIQDGAFSTYDMSLGRYSLYTGSSSTVTGIEEVVAPWGTVNGTTGSDVIKITSFNKTYAGNGRAFGGGGSDIISADEGSMAELHGGDGVDTITSLGQDKIYGDGEMDYLYGGAYTTLIDGGSGNDWIYAAPGQDRMTTIYTGSGINHVINTGAANRAEVVYSFTKSMTDGDGGGLISVTDRGGSFEVVTTQGTDFITGVANLLFAADSSGWMQSFYLKPGVNYNHADPTSQYARSYQDVVVMDEDGAFMSVENETFSFDFDDNGPLVWRPDLASAEAFDQIRMVRDDGTLPFISQGDDVHDVMAMMPWGMEQASIHSDLFM